MASEKNLNAVFSDIANSIRSKKGTTDTIQPINMASEIDSIETGSVDTRFKEIVEGTITSIDDSTITTVNDYAFAYMRSLTSVNLPNATHLRPSAFWYCEALENINVPNVISVEQNALSHINAKTINLPKATIIKNDAFNYDTSLISLSIPLVEKIESYAFRNCPNLASIDMNSPVVSEYCFYGCSSLKSAKIKTNPHTYNVGGVFNGCTSLERAEIYDCYDIGSYYFCNCSSLKQVIIRKTTRVGLNGSTSFEGSLIATSTTEGFIYVPDNLVESYKSATNWTVYASKIKGLSELGE